jgi:hypothetical protein
MSSDPRTTAKIKDLERIAENMRSEIAPEEWNFSFYTFPNTDELVGCFTWEYLREHPALDTLNRAEFVDEMLDSFWRLKFRRDLNLFYNGVPAKVIMAVLNMPGELQPWMAMNEKEKAAILNAPIRPPLIPVKLESDDFYRWSYKAPKLGSVPGNEAVHAYWQHFIEQFKKEPLPKNNRPRAAKPSKPKKAPKTTAYLEVPDKFRDSDMLIASWRKGGILVHPAFLVNFLDHSPEELKCALSAWVDETYPTDLMITERRGTFKDRDIWAHLKRLAVMRLMNKFYLSIIQERGLRRFVEDTTDRDFYTDRTKAKTVFLKYFSFEVDQVPRHFEKI